VALVSWQLAVVVNAASSSSLLCFGYVICLLCFFFGSLLSTVFLPLCSGFVEVLLVLAVPLVAMKMRTGRGTRRMLLQFFFSVFSSSSSCFSCASFTPLPLFLSQIFFPFPVLLSFYVHGFPFFFLFFLSVFSPFFPVFFLPLLLLLPLCLFLLPLVRFLLWLYN